MKAARRSPMALGGFANPLLGGGPSFRGSAGLGLKHGPLLLAFLAGCAVTLFILLLLLNASSALRLHLIFPGAADRCPPCSCPAATWAEKERDSEGSQAREEPSTLSERSYGAADGGSSARGRQLEDMEGGGRGAGRGAGALKLKAGKSKAVSAVEEGLGEGEAEGEGGGRVGEEVDEEEEEEPARGRAQGREGGKGRGREDAKGGEEEDGEQRMGDGEGNSSSRSRRRQKGGERRSSMQRGSGSALHTERDVSVLPSTDSGTESQEGACAASCLGKHILLHSSNWTRATKVESAWIYQQNLRRRDRAAGKHVARFVDNWYERTQDSPALKDSAFVMEVMAPVYPCFPEERFGTWLAGGKWVCRPSRLNASSVVYSIGSKGADSFERELYGRTKAQIHVFDNSLSSAAQLKMSTQRAYRFHPVGLGATTHSGSKLMRYQDILKSLRHSRIDVLKLDCDGCEYDVLPNILKSYPDTGPPPFTQLQVQLHAITRKHYKRVLALLLQLEERGFRMFHLEPSWRVSTNADVAFVHHSLC